jgi:NAD(P)-dependent dehydrogenase (short-subunit alcohol dehydrogenase family)
VTGGTVTGGTVTGGTVSGGTASGGTASGVSLAGQSALVTGGGGGIGGAVARGLAEAGAAVTVADIDGAAAAAVAAEISAAGGRAAGLAADVSRVEGVRALFAELDRAGGPPLGVVVNVAGVIRYASLLDQEERDFDDIVNVNLKGTFFCLQEAARRMVARGGGSVINMASTAAFVAGRVPAPAYAMSKAGIRQLTVSAAVELAPRGVRVNAVAPATVETTFTQHTLTTPAQLEAARARVPLGRIGQPADIVGAVLFLASDAASYITGQTIVIDGGILGRAG